MSACGKAGSIGRALLTVGLAALFVPLGHAAPAAAQQRCAPHGSTIEQQSWAQLALDAPQAWSFATGSGVTVGVLDTGVDAGHPQLRGVVQAGTNLFKKGSGNTDCVGHGTEVAGIIAAQQSKTMGFRGIAPNAAILPVTITDQIDDSDRSSDDPSPEPATMAQGIRYAVDHGASVINVSVVVHQNSSALKSAVEYAIAHNAVVVAAVGNLPESAKQATPYPAAYDGVIGVGSVDPSDAVQEGTASGSFVDLVAPGVSVISTARDHGLTFVTGTDVAAAAVSGTAALVRSWRSDLDPAEVTQRLEATATPMAGGPGSPEYGHGMVNPYRAVTEMMATGSPKALPTYHAPHTPAAAAARARTWHDSSNLALLIAGLGLLLVLAVLGAAIAIPRGRRRRWRPSLATPPRDTPEDDMPAPPVELFEKQS